MNCLVDARELAEMREQLEQVRELCKKWRTPPGAHEPLGPSTEELMEAISKAVGERA